MRVLCLVLILMLSGCVNRVANLSNHLSLEPNEPLIINDERERDSLKGEFLSNLITSCDYGVERLGEDKIEPLRLEILNDLLSNKYSQTFSGEIISVFEFDIYSNRAVVFRHIAYGSAGVEGELMRLAVEPFFNDCPLESSIGAYTKEEASTPYSPIIIWFDVQHNGQRVKTRTVYSPEEEFMGQYHSPEGADALYKAIETAVDDLVIELGTVTAKHAVK
ncbi:hypothetical protein CS022_01290 [Veronia nyctiphanis]|uniref:ABC-type transport auxiliary lipoprotein component domain-containing protein n=1 Tax=Veronia nyctiphanis TaxID=1278244 RepID=A0A4Q0YUB0_9GAMM|nr:hypothetical protein [Veronia nyctiphanis]RXJ74866.1 hypothetical protein CS022_01290 [Veronia nyctiphanis]